MTAETPFTDPARLRAALHAWYRRHHRDLPWRRTRDPYAIWVSEVMLQQTTVSAVVPYFIKWMKVFPDIPSLGRAPLQKVLKTWQGLGYYQRAKNMHRAAGILVQEYGGRLPSDPAVLGSLPGFGPYTTAAVLSLAFDEPVPVIDANVRRILMRLSRLEQQAHPRHDPQLLRFLNPLLPEKHMGMFNQSLMELGALVCRPRNPRCLGCPFMTVCRAFEAGRQEVIPRPKQRSYTRIEAAVGIIRNGERILIQKRPADGLMGDLWEFPGGKLRRGEAPEQALRREIREELGAEVSKATHLLTVNHAYTRFQVTLHAFDCALRDPPPLPRPNRRWVTLRGLSRFPFPSGSAKIVNHLRARKKPPS